MKYIIDKEEYDLNIKNAKQYEYESGQWDTVDMLYKVLMTGYSNTKFGENVSKEKKEKFELLCKILSSQVRY